MDYSFESIRSIEKKWQKYWSENKTFRSETRVGQPKYYVLDMFPYPSGAGLHVGHPLGYIASDIYARYKRLKGFNVLHPMGYDSFGLPAEQYAIQTGQHPAVTTAENINRYREQLDNIGFSFDWSREVQTSDPLYYKWTQWIFIQLFHSWYNNRTNKAEPVESLIAEFERSGNSGIDAACDEGTPSFTAEEWKEMTEKQQQKILLKYRLTYLSEAMVNWCPALGTVLANDEVKDGFSERGGHPVVRKLMMQWSMRITAYAERLLNDLETIDWPDSIKEAQRNWIGRSEGCSLRFRIENSDLFIEVFTTRPDTVFGVTFLTLAPEHELIGRITASELKDRVNTYVGQAANRSERERMAEVKRITGEFTGAYAIHPFTGEKIPVWTGDYVLSGYGTGAVMAVPGHDSRDYAFAKHFGLAIKEVVEGGDISKEAYEAKEGKIINSDFLDGLHVKAAIKRAIEEIERRNAGRGKINYRLRDAVFGRQRYWGEPIPIYYRDGIPYSLPEKELPLVLPEVDKYLPTEDGEPPLARAKEWSFRPEESGETYPLETTTMPGWAGSSWYFLRYMDAGNEKEFVSREAVNYWQEVDLYIGGAEHATGHLLYVRYWTKFLFDRGWIPRQEPARKLINQGMIQGRSNLVYRYRNTAVFITKSIADKVFSGALDPSGLDSLIKKETEADIPPAGDEEAGVPLLTPLRVDVNMVENDVLDTEAFKSWRPEYAQARFVLEDGRYICGVEIEKMSKSKWNVINPDDLIERYGADTLRLYEMFLGPLELSKPWNTNGITGVFNFLKKLWRLFHDTEGRFAVSDEAPSEKELRILHKTIRKVEEDIERFSFNTSVSTFMICVNELTELKCNKRAILGPLCVILCPYAPHIAEELWERMGNKESISRTSFPTWEEEYLKESSFEYPVSINGKTRTKLNLSLQLNKEQVEKEVLSSEEIQKWLQGSSPKKIIVVPGRIINIVI
jgi:leucyl-tRNA synthetase